MTTNRRLLRVEEAAAFLNVKPSTVRAWILRRKVPYHKVGRSVRIAEGDLERMIEQARIPTRDHTTKPRPKVEPFDPRAWREEAGAKDDRTKPKRKGNDNASESPRIQPQS